MKIIQVYSQCVYLRLAESKNIRGDIHDIFLLFTLYIGLDAVRAAVSSARAGSGKYSQKRRGHSRRQPQK